MNMRASIPLSFCLALGLMSPTMAADKDIELPAPQKSGGKPLMDALKERKSTREFKKDPIPMPVLSSLLWAALGVNRDHPDYRTAPSTRNCNAIELYVVTEKFTYLYDPVKHRLSLVMQGDLRAATGMQEFVGHAPLNLVYVADYSKYPGDFTDEKKLTASCADAGFIGQNVYLYCASAGLGCVFRAMVDKNTLHDQMCLPALKKVIYAQTVGYPAKP